MLKLMESTSNFLKWLSNVLDRIALEIDLKVINTKLSIDDNELPEDLGEDYVK